MSERDRKSEQLQHLQRAVTGFKSGIEKLVANQRTLLPTGPYGETFNRLLDTAKKLMPDVDSAIWPPKVEIGVIGGQPLCTVRYPELLSYAEMILNQIGEDDPLSYIGRG